MDTMKFFFSTLSVCIVSLLASTNNGYSANCRYFSYIQYGEFMNSGNPSDLRKGYKVGSVRKTKGNTYASGAGNVINIGPFDSESSLILERRLAVEDLKAKGYELNGNILFPGVLIKNQIDC